MPYKTLCLHYNAKLLSDVFRQTFAVYCVNKTNKAKIDFVEEMQRYFMLLLKQGVVTNVL